VYRSIDYVLKIINYLALVFFTAHPHCSHIVSTLCINTKVKVMMSGETHIFTDRLKGHTLAALGACIFNGQTDPLILKLDGQWMSVSLKVWGGYIPCSPLEL